MQQRLRFTASIATGILLAWFFTFPASVNALGFGNINMKSALNEPLHAEIELLSATPDDIKNLEVKLASREAFLRAGVDRSVLLSRIKFDISKRSGKYYVVLRTQESVREPFLNFLLEMNWKSGRMLREYTVLLDPPDRIQRQQQIATAPETTPAVTAPAPEPIPEPAPIAEAQPAPAPVESPFVDSPAPVEPTADSEPFPAIPLDQPAQVAEDAVAVAQPEPAPAPAPVAAPEPVPVPEPLAAPEPVPAPEPVAVPEPVPAPTEFVDAEPAFEEADTGLFPAIPLRAYNEADLDVVYTPKQAAAPAVPGEAPAEPVTYQPVGDLDYGITQKGDTAWNVAQKLRPSEQISVYQVMMALQQSNPSAFVEGNIHRLKEGQVLRIDDPSLLTAMSKEQAAQQYQTQTQVWEDYLASVGVDVPRQAIVAGDTADTTTDTGTPSGELTLATPKEDTMSAGTGTELASGADSDVLRAQARQAMQEAQAERVKNAELTTRLNELEKELQRLENLVNIKDSDLASLQRKLDELNAQRGQTDIATAEPAPVAEPEPLPEPEPQPAPQDIAPDPIPEQQDIAPPPPDLSETESQIADATEAAPADIDAPADAGPGVTPPAPVEAPTLPSEPAPSVTAETGGIMDTVMGMLGGVKDFFSSLGKMALMIIGGVVGLVVLLLVFVMIRRRRGIHFQESILNSGTADAVAEGPAATAQIDATPSQPSSSSMMGGESSFLSDFAISGVSAIQAEDSEVDPLTEADVFMAYGRYEAAEERLQEAINQDPNRGELRVKLLELFNTTKNKQGFESAAEDFYAAAGDGAANDPLWQKVVAMGKEIAPGNPLFSGAGAPNLTESQINAAVPEPAEVGQGEVMDIGLDTGVFSTSEFNPVEGPDTEAAAEAYTSGGDLDFNLDGTSNTENTDTALDDGLDFSLGGDTATTGDEDTSETDGGALDFNLDMDTSSSDEDTLDSLAPGDEGLDFSLGDDSAASSADDSMEFSLDDAGDEPTATDIKLDMDEPASAELDFDLQEDSADAGMDMNLDAGDALDLEMPSGGDEVGTKLDLARAYIDMGDPDGARSILDEVMEEGNDNQKQEAEQLMAQIG